VTLIGGIAFDRDERDDLVRTPMLLRTWARRLRRIALEATNVLPTLGFGRPAEPPIEPVHRSDTASEAAQDSPPLHEQQHVVPGRRINIDKSTG